MIEVYTKPDCPQCRLTKNELVKLGADFELIDVTQDDGALALVQRLGYSSAPVVVVANADGTLADHWSGFRPDRIRSHAA